MIVKPGNGRYLPLNVKYLLPFAAQLVCCMAENGIIIKRRNVYGIK